MELGLSFDDDLFAEVRQKEVAVNLTSYNAKYCPPKWFTNANLKDEEGERQLLKFRGDHAYRQKQFPEALTHLTKALELVPSHNLAMRRDLGQSVARAAMKLGRYEQALTMAKQLVQDCPNQDQRGESLHLMSQVCHAAGDGTGAIEALQECITLHPFNADFWLFLGEIYESRSKTLNTAAVSSARHTHDKTMTKTQGSPGSQSTAVDESRMLVHQEDAMKKSSAGQNTSDNQGIVPTESTLELQTTALRESTTKTLATGLDDGKSAEGSTRIANTQDTAKMNAASAQKTTSLSTATKMQENAHMSNTLNSTVCLTHSTPSNDESSSSNCLTEKAGLLASEEKPHTSSGIPVIHATEVSLHTSPPDAEALLSQSASLSRVQRLEKEQVILVTCLVRARILLHSVQTSVTTFVKERHQVLLNKIAEKLEEMCIPEKIMNQAEQFLIQDIYNREGNAQGGRDGSPYVDHQHFEARWFSWT